MSAELRIVSLCPSNTEIVAALGLADNLVGIDNYSDYPERELEHLPRLGPDLQIDIEHVKRLRPDLILSSLSVPGMERVTAGLEQAGLAHIVLNPKSFHDIFEDIHAVARATDDGRVELRARLLTEKYKEQLEAVERFTRAREKRKVYWEWWPKPVFSPAKNNWLTELSEYVGLQNVFGDMPGDQVRGDDKMVIAAEPDIACIVWTGIPQAKVPCEKVRTRPGYEGVPAWKQNSVFVLSEGLYCRPSPRLITGMLQMTSLLHPESRRMLGLEPPAAYAPVL